ARPSRPEHSSAHDSRRRRHVDESAIPPDELRHRTFRYNRAFRARFMPLILKLRGSPAVSAFRLDKLNASLAAIHRSLRVTAAEFGNSAEAERPLAAPEREVLARFFEYGEPATPGTGPVRLVVPRLGTISPWSSKATDIAHRCGLDAVRRIERGTAWFFATTS